MGLEDILIVDTPDALLVTKKSLSQDLKLVSILKLSELIEEKNLSMDCIQGDCELINSCNIASPIKKLNHYVNSFFETLSVEDLLSDEGMMHLKLESVP